MHGPGSTKRSGQHTPSPGWRMDAPGNERSSNPRKPESCEGINDVSAENATRADQKALFQSSCTALDAVPADRRRCAPASCAMRMPAPMTPQHACGADVACRKCTDSWRRWRCQIAIPPEEQYRLRTTQYCTSYSEGGRNRDGLLARSVTLPRTFGATNFRY